MKEKTEQQDAVNTAEVLPQTGGSYIRNPDGSLTQVEFPTIVAEVERVSEKE